MYNVVSIIYGIVTSVFTGYCLTYYFDSFMERRKKFQWNGKYLLIILYEVLDYLLDYLFQTSIETKETIGKQIIFLIVVFIFAKLFYRSGLQLPVFLTITFVSLKDLSAFISTTISLCSEQVFDLWLWLLEIGSISIETTDKLVNGTASMIHLAMMAVYNLLLYKSLKMVVKNYKNKDYLARKEEWLFLLTPGCVGYLLCMLLRAILITMEDGIQLNIYDKYPELIPVVPSIMILALLSIVYSVKLFQDMITVNEEKSQKLILEKQVKSMQEHIAEMERIYSGVRSMKHDMKNTLSVIMQLSVNEENTSNEELQNYLAQLKQTMDSMDFYYKTGNSVVDILLNMKKHELIRSIPDIQLNADRLLFPNNLQIQSYDIGIIIGNALDNAIEACMKLKEQEEEAEAFITLSSFTTGRMFFLEVENSFDGKIVCKKNSEFPITDKKDKKIHGIGLSNIKNTAVKYHGGVDWSAGNRKFTLTVMLQNVRKL